MGQKEEYYDKLVIKVIKYCVPIWNLGHIVDDDIVFKIKVCADLHPEYFSANKMAGIVLERNRKDKEALPYLEKLKHTKDTYVLRSLMECYYRSKEKEKAEKICQQLYPLLGQQEREKLKARAIKWNLKCP